MNVALTLGHLVYGAQYLGSLTANDQAAYDAIEWLDERPKPTWQELLDAWPEAYRRSKPLTELLDEIIQTGEQELVESPLPDDVQESIYDLRALILTYPPSKANLIQNKINAFDLPSDEDRPDITAFQRGKVAAMKQQMLALFS